MTLPFHALILLIILAGGRGHTVPDAGGKAAVVVDDFEGDRVRAIPSRWQWLSGRSRAFEPLDSHVSDQRQFRVVQEGGNKFVRAYTEAAAIRMSVAAEDYGWDLTERPFLSWRWRAVRLPAGAREDHLNDAGGAVVVTFSRTDFWGRPHSIKYTYSTALRVDQEVSFGNLKVIVASSGQVASDQWIDVKRNVAEDYSRVFGRKPPDRPFAITLWSDSDDTKSEAEVDFDDIRFHR